jgi:hypothetical protein
MSLDPDIPSRKLDGTPSRMTQVIQTLRANPKGLTIRQIAEAIGRVEEIASIHSAIRAAKRANRFGFDIVARGPRSNAAITVRINEDAYQRYVATTVPGKRLKPGVEPKRKRKRKVVEAPEPVRTVRPPLIPINAKFHTVWQPASPYHKG